MRIVENLVIWFALWAHFTLFAILVGCEITIASVSLIGAGVAGLVYTLNWRVNKWIEGDNEFF